MVLLIRGELRTDRKILKLFFCLCISISHVLKWENFSVLLSYFSGEKYPMWYYSSFFLRSLDLLVFCSLSTCNFTFYFSILLLSQDNVIGAHQLIIIFFCSLAVSDHIGVHCALLYASDLKHSSVSENKYSLRMCCSDVDLGRSDT